MPDVAGSSPAERTLYWQFPMGGGAIGSPPGFDLGWSRFKSWSPSSCLLSDQR